jgi:hypothetical protein
MVGSNVGITLLFCLIYDTTTICIRKVYNFFSKYIVTINRLLADEIPAEIVHVYSTREQVQTINTYYTGIGMR